ncbi:hypothetical protein OS493_040217, partial [Desmophyllum pertusum]
SRGSPRMSTDLTAGVMLSVPEMGQLACPTMGRTPTPVFCKDICCLERNCRECTVMPVRTRKKREE